jgi:mono/diheme cytochrome c family protein
MTRGKELFGQRCASCHSLGTDFPTKEATASELAGFGTEQWIADLLNNPGDKRFFGRTKLVDMDNWVKRKNRSFDRRLNDPDATSEDKAEVRKEMEQRDADFKLIARWLAGHPRTLPKAGDEKSPDEAVALHARGFQAYERQECLNCHKFAGRYDGTGTRGPDFTGYGDTEWIRQMIMAPDHPDRYGWRYHNAMPVFRDLEGIDAEVLRQDLARHHETVLNDARQTSSRATTVPVEEIKESDEGFLAKMTAPAITRVIATAAAQPDFSGLAAAFPWSVVSLHQLDTRDYAILDFLNRKAQIAAASRLDHLSDLDRELIIRYLTKDPRAVFGGNQIAGVKKE